MGTSIEGLFHSEDNSKEGTSNREHGHEARFADPESQGGGTNREQEVRQMDSVRGMNQDTQLTQLTQITQLTL